MTDPWTDRWQELDRSMAEAGRLAQPASIDEVRHLARRRRRLHVVGVGTALVVIVVGVGVGIGFGDNLRRADPGPATQHITIPGPTSTPSSPTSPTSRSTRTTPTTPSTPTTPTGPTTPTTSTPTATPPSDPRRYDDIPAGYPWLSFVQDLGGDEGIDGPGERVEAPQPAPCHRRTWNPQRFIARLTLSTNFPEFYQDRQIVVFPDAAAARRALDRVRSAFSRCPIQRSPRGFGIRFVVSPPGTAGPTTPEGGRADAWLAVSARQLFHGAAAVGLEEMRWTRISNAVIFTYDFSEALSDDPRMGREADRLVSRMLTTWCRLAGGC